MTILPTTASAVALAAGLAVLPASGQIFRIAAPDTASGAWFGTSVAISGERVVVGATGVNACGPNSGAAYVYERADDFTWRLDAVLRPDECLEEQFFGRAVTADGDRIAVTAFRPYFSGFRSNAVHLYERGPDSTWRHTARIDAPGSVAEDAFASSIALSGNRILVTSAGDSGPDAHDGVGYVFEPDADGEWRLAARLEGEPGTGRFGVSCALDGDLAAVSATSPARRQAGTVFLFGREPDGRWTRKARFGPIRDAFVPMDADGGRFLVGQRDAGPEHSGIAILYEPTGGGSWRGTARLRDPEPYPAGGFGSGVALSGPHALVAGFDEQLQFDYNIDRVVHVFARDGSGAWVPRQVIDVGETHFGAALDADGDLAVIGAATDGIPGAAYVVRLR